MPTIDHHRTWLEIDLSAIAYNFREASKRLPAGCSVIAIVKADSYGLGACRIARTLEAEGCGYFGVATIDEAEELRAAGISARIMTLSPVAIEKLASAVEKDIEFPIVSLGQAREYAKAAKAMGKAIKGQLKLDIGLSRIGIPLAGRFDEAKAEVLEILGLEGLEITSLISHCTNSTSLGGDYFNRAQLRLYQDMIQEVEGRGYSLEYHCLSSGSYTRYPECSYNYVRLGALLYGSVPDAELPFELKPVVGLYAKILQLKWVPAGAAISYGPISHTLRPTLIATLGYGFSDGIRRSLINGGRVIIRGQWAPYIGKLCSDYSMVDVTDVEGVQEGDIATLFGRDGSLSQGVEDYAAIYPASVSETTASITGRIPRFYINDSCNKII